MRLGRPCFLAGTILVSVNPFCWMPELYEEGVLLKYINQLPGEPLPPHIFGIGAAAYRGVKNEQEDQSVIISGESGAGKTEATKKCLQFLAEAAGAGTEGLEDRLLSANPILEAFGNAKTLRNNNSSRFGKWMAVHFNERAQICSSEIINYLLEKSRVVRQEEGERNYHIFFQLVTSPRYREKFSLGPVEDYHFTNQSNCVEVAGIPDDDDLVATFESLWKIDSLEPPSDFEEDPRPPAKYEPLLQVVAGVLHLGNISFEELDESVSTTGGCCVAKDARSQRSLEIASKLMGFTKDGLARGLEHKVIQSARERISKELTPAEGADARNSLARAVYGRMFDWLVAEVNRSMLADRAASRNVIGVLDIFGFEIFPHNSFEQLCINYCNEKLQQHFNNHIFKMEEQCYQSEGIDYSEVQFIDNQDVLDVVEKKPHGLLPMLDNEVKLGKRGTDENFLQQVDRLHGDSHRYILVTKGGKNRNMPRLAFGINHYAGPVFYDADGFLDKNKDDLFLNLHEICQQSTVDFIRELFPTPGEDDPASPATPGGAATPSGAARPRSGSHRHGRKETLATQFRRQLEELMRTLQRTFPHFVRCVKPNDEKQSRSFDAPLCL